MRRSQRFQGHTNAWGGPLTGGLVDNSPHLMHDSVPTCPITNFPTHKSCCTNARGGRYGRLEDADIRSPIHSLRLGRLSQAISICTFPPHPCTYFFLTTNLPASIIHRSLHNTSPIFISGVSAPKIKAEAPTEPFSSPTIPIQLQHYLLPPTLRSLLLILVVSRHPSTIKMDSFPVIVWKRKKAFALLNCGFNPLVRFKAPLNHLHLQFRPGTMSCRSPFFRQITTRHGICQLHQSTHPASLTYFKPIVLGAITA
jgi:hypothetical protein